MKDKKLLSSFILPFPPPLHYQRCQLPQITWESPGYRTNPRSLPSCDQIFQIEAVLIFPLHSAWLLTPNLPTFNFLNSCYVSWVYSCGYLLQKFTENKRNRLVMSEGGGNQFLAWWGGSIWVNFFYGNGGKGVRLHLKKSSSATES